MLSILSSTSILIIFKILDRLKIDVFHVIIINYAIAFTMGFFLNRGAVRVSQLGISQSPWLYLSMLIGVCLITMFFVIGVSTQKAGISVTSISSKICVIIPMLFSIFYYHEAFSRLKALGIVLALLGLGCTVLKKHNNGIDNRYVFLPLLLFLGLGGLDVLVKFVQHEYITDETSAVFTGASFFFAFVSGIAICLARQVPVGQFFKTKVLIAGIFLGISNFGSMFFLINALNSHVFDSSVVFGINNIAIVGLSVFSAAVLFREKLSALNWVGVVLSLAAIAIFINA